MLSKRLVEVFYRNPDGSVGYFRVGNVSAVNTTGRHMVVDYVSPSGEPSSTSFDTNRIESFDIYEAVDA